MAIIILRDGSDGGNRICTLRCDNCEITYPKTYINAVRAKHHFCCLDCRREWEKDITHQPAWKGGKVTMLNYEFTKVKDHLSANREGYVKTSRLIMEKLIGRYLTPEETIHHINGNRSDDRPENLMLFKNNSKHQLYHWELKKQETSKTLVLSNFGTL